MPSNRAPSSYLAVSSAAIFLSAFLLFALEPLIARQILPWFGGSAAVWSTCLVFYQTALLIGYLYARLLIVFVAPRAQAALHAGLLAISFALLPIGIGAAPLARNGGPPQLVILWLLTRSIGLPFLLLSATTPLVQAWLARGGSSNPYGMFAVSNFASLAALLAYPSLAEPWLDTPAQRIGWSAGYLLFAACCALAGWLARSGGPAEGPARHLVALAERVPAQQKLLWFVLPACSSMLLLAITNHLDENVAAVPLLWVLPLCVYLLSFIFAFGLPRTYHRPLWLRVLAFALGIMGYAIYDINTVEPIQINLPVFLLALFVCCFFCHGELNRIRPGAANLTSFYLLIAAGGAAGAIFVGIVAPVLFPAIYELPLTFVAIAVLALVLVWKQEPWGMRLLWLGTAVCMAAVVISNVQGYTVNTVSLRRSFYGSLRVVQTPRAGPQQQRILFHGTVEHGSQFVLPPGRFRPTTYYGPDSGIGIVLRECLPSPRRVAVVGLGAGTLAAYGKRGDDFAFFEINPQVTDIARGLFFYLRESAAVIRVVPGDARLSLQAEASPPLDLIVLDAFSGDAIPIHLLTREAIKVYLSRLRRGGVLAFHTSNNYLDLPPVIQQLTEAAGLHTILVHSHADEDSATLPADWVVATEDESLLENPALRLHVQPIASRNGRRPWTDDYNNLLQIFKMPALSSR